LKNCQNCLWCKTGRIASTGRNKTLKIHCKQHMWTDGVGVERPYNHRPGMWYTSKAFEEYAAYCPAYDYMGE
jgi:hypothetical protein